MPFPSTSRVSTNERGARQSNSGSRSSRTASATTTVFRRAVEVDCGEQRGSEDCTLDSHSAGWSRRHRIRSRTGPGSDGAGRLIVAGRPHCSMYPCRGHWCPGLGPRHRFVGERATSYRVDARNSSSFLPEAGRGGSVGVLPRRMHIATRIQDPAAGVPESSSGVTVEDPAGTRRQQAISLGAGARRCHEKC